VLPGLRVVLLALCLQGCATVASYKAAAVCQIADGVTTYYGLTHGATELNGFLAGLGPGGILFLKLLLSYGLWKVAQDRGVPNPNQKAVMGAMSITGCVAAAHNLSVIRHLK
jgi:Domain of unknown function (DUF5658)